MFVPISAHSHERSWAPVNLLLIVANLVAFAQQGWLALQGEPSLTGAFVPLRFLLDPLAEAPNVLTAMFMHGDVAHLLGNLLFLRVFGASVEAAMGSSRYLYFYVLSGVGATLAHFAVGPDSALPLVGASGAIAGVMAAYLVLYPRAPVRVLNLFLFPLPVLIVPAYLLIGMWFLLQLVSGLGSLGEETGVAFFAHVGGFLAGLLLVRPFAFEAEPAPAPRRWPRPSARRVATRWTR